MTCVYVFDVCACMCVCACFFNASYVGWQQFCYNKPDEIQASVFSDITSRRGEVGERDSGQLSGRLLQITGKLVKSICVCIVSQIGKFWNFEKKFPAEVFQSNASKGTDMQMLSLSHFMCMYSRDNDMLCETVNTA